MDPERAPKWLPNGSQKISQMDPQMAPKWIPKEVPKSAWSYPPLAPPSQPGTTPQGQVRARYPRAKTCTLLRVYNIRRDLDLLYNFTPAKIRNRKHFYEKKAKLFLRREVPNDVKTRAAVSWCSSVVVLWCRCAVV